VGTVISPRTSERLGRHLLTSGVSGASAAVVRPGEVVWSAGAGRLASGADITAVTPFMLGSVSKVVTGTLVMQLIEQGLLDLDGDINRVLPFGVHLPCGGAPITLRGLASHTSGILDRNPEYASPYGPGDPQQSLADFLRSYLISGGTEYDPQGNFGPAGTYAYSNVGVALAALAAEHRMGRSFADLCSASLFGPLGLRNTGWFLRDFADQSLIAEPRDDAGRVLPHYGYPTYPDGQLRSSAADLGRFLATVLAGGVWDRVRVLRPDTLDRMWETQHSAPQEDQLLFWTRKQGLIGHLGGDDGVLTFLYLHPHRAVGLVLLTNQQTAEARALGRTLVREVLLDSSGLL
jgi:CubicO group peptidase (beta-lactamase class C family)